MHLGDRRAIRNASLVVPADAEIFLSARDGVRVRRLTVAAIDRVSFA